MWSEYLDTQVPVCDWFAPGGPSVPAIQQRVDLFAEAVDRKQLASILTARLKQRQAPASALHNVNRLGSDAFTVVTGQQPAYGVGPLYTLVKVAHAVALAAELEAAGTPCVPIFWCGSEDHDLGEAGHANLYDRRGQRQRLNRKFDQLGASLHHQAADGEWQILTDALQNLDIGSLGHDWWTELRPIADEPLGAWTCRVIEQAFADHGLICIEAHDLRPLMTQQWKLSIEQWPAASLADRAQAITKAGYEAPFGNLSQPPIFRDTLEGRQRLGLDDAQDQLTADPFLLSPGAGLRPIMQQAALPAVAAVVGPGELTYHAQLGPIYPALGVNAPTLVPRLSVTLAPSWVQRGLAAWSVSANELEPGRKLPQQDLSNIEDLSALDATLAQLSTSNNPRVASAVKRLQRERDRLVASLLREQRILSHKPPIGELQAWLYPDQHGQDRRLSASQALFCWGPGLANELVSTATGAHPGSHHLLTV